jgi:aryl sulfotransferase
MLIRKPEKAIRTWHTDSRIWDSFELRAGDIIVCTPPKTGTTWTQRIVGMLLAQSAEPRQIMEEQPWLDARFIPTQDVAAALSAVQGRRGLKSHSPLTALPLHDDVLYINVARDPRDAVMSFHNHNLNFTEDFLAGMDQIGLGDPLIAAPFPRAPEDPRAFFRRWLRDPHYAPFDDFTIAEFLEIETSFWEARERPNVLLVHYNDLKADRAGEMRRRDAPDRGILRDRNARPPICRHGRSGRLLEHEARRRAASGACGSRLQGRGRCLPSQGHE